MAKADFEKGLSAGFCRKRGCRDGRGQIVEAVPGEGLGAGGEVVHGRRVSVQRWCKAKEVPKAVLTGSL